MKTLFAIIAVATALCFAGNAYAIGNKSVSRQRIVQKNVAPQRVQKIQVQRVQQVYVPAQQLQQVQRIYVPAQQIQQLNACPY